MTPEQKTLFREQGILYIRAALDNSLTQPVKTHVLNELKRLKIWAAGRSLSQRFKGVPIFQQTGKLGQLIHYPHLSERLISQALHAAMYQLTGVTLSSGQEAQLLISLPHRADWALDGLNWHRDIAQPQGGRSPGVQTFILLDDLSAKGGATLALAGSHRLKNQAQAKAGISQLMNGDARRSVSVDGTALSLVEMTGRAGDVYLMDMRLLHTPSINATKRVRLMATTRHFARN